MAYEKYYPGGWKSGESGGTPITPEALNHMEEGIENAVPTSRTVNGKELTEDITLSASDVGAAASSHNHSASNITSGTLSSDRLPTVPIAKGGLGGTDRLTSAKNLTNESVSSPGFVVSLTSNWKNFGYTTLQQLRNAAGLGNTTGALPVANGGTGMTTATTASATSAAHTAYFTKFGNLIVCTLVPRTSKTSILYDTSLTIPSGYRPNASMTFTIYSNNSVGAGGSGLSASVVASGSTLKMNAAYGITVEEASRTFSWVAS